MSISKEDVIYVSRLAQIELPEDQQKSLVKDMKQIVQFVEKINELPTDNVEPLASVLDIHNVTREDVPKKGLETKTIEGLAPKFETGHIVVPAVMD